jgi:hypothetical protein
MHCAPKILLPALILACTLSAQTQKIVYHTDSSPTLGSRNAWPFGYNGMRYQTIVPYSTFGGGAVIRDILLVGTASPLEVDYTDIEIRMGLTKLSGPTTNWNTNNPNPTTVYRGPLRVRFAVGKWGGIGLPNYYLYLPRATTDNLCVEVIVWGVRGKNRGAFYFLLASATAGRAASGGWVVNQTLTPAVSTMGCKMGFVLNNGNVAFAGTGCKSSLQTPLTIGATAWPQINRQFSVTLTGGKPSSLANLVLGVSHAKWGPTALPLDMAIFGAPTCFIWNDPLIRIPVTTDANGKVSITTIVPPSANSGTVFAHWWVLDRSANPFGVTSSDYATIILGN